MISIFQPQLGEEELNAIKKVFASNWIGKGKVTDQFEQDFASFIKSPRENFISANCCTEALFQALKIFEIGSGDEVIVPSVSFVAVANAVLDCGAKLVFCDVDPLTLNATAELIEQKITKKTKAIFLLHYSVPCELDAILKLAELHNIKIIEDTASSPFSTYKGKATGTFGDIGTWSFDAMKILVAGDGSMVYCKTKDIAEKMSRLLYLGLKTASGFSNKVDNKWWEFDIDCYGRRAIMNDIGSAIGVEQLKKVPQFLEARKKVYDFYDQNLKNLDWLTTQTYIPAHTTISYYFYRIQKSIF